jgi:hypothetical protein
LGGPGRLPLYDAADVARVRTAKRALGVQTALDSVAPSLGAALRADPAFEVLHFVPLLYPGSTPEAMLAAVRRAAESAGSGWPGPQELLGSAALSTSVSTPEERGLLRTFVVALQDEWARFYRDYQAHAIAPESLASAAGAWGPLADSLRPYFAWAGLAHGQILVSPALGPDGRFWQDPSDTREGNRVAVWLPPDRPADAAFFAVRELCYPAVRRALPEAAMPADRARAEDLSGRAAVRCGEMLMRRFAPGMVEAYRLAWMRAVGARGSFEGAFSVPADVARALERTLEF